MSRLLEAIAVVAELTGTELSKPAILAIMSDLSAYPEPVALKALDRCRKELKGRLTVAAILERIQADDGRPSANEAWAIALRYFDETQTVVLTEEIRQACAAARPVMESGDEVGARMAFRDAYERLVSEARNAGAMPQWVPSIGTDQEQRSLVLTEAAQLGKLSHSQVAGLLPAPLAGDGAAIAGLLEGKSIPVSGKCREHLDRMREILRGKAAA